MVAIRRSTALLLAAGALALLEAFSVGPAVAPQALAEDGGTVLALELRLRERTPTLEHWSHSRGGEYRLDVAARLNGTAPPDSFGLDVGRLRFDVPLARGRFEGNLPDLPGRNRVTVRARGGHLRATVRGRTTPSPDESDFPGGVVWGHYLDYFGSATHGLHPATVRLGGSPIEGALGTVARRLWKRFAHGHLLVGAGLFPALPDPGSLFLPFPENPRLPWTGRIRCCILSRNAVPALSISVGGGFSRALVPSEPEFSFRGVGESVAGGIHRVEAGGRPVFLVSVDSAVPEAIGPGEWTLAWDDGSVFRRVPLRRGEPPPPTRLRDLDTSLHVLEVQEDGRLRAWGENGAGALGDGTLRDRREAFVVSLDCPVVRVAAGPECSLAVDSRGRVWWWGTLRTRTGAGDEWYDRHIFSRSRVPRCRGDLPWIRSVAAGEFHTLALDASGRVWAWGENESGALGDGGTEDRPWIPARIPGLREVVEVAVGDEYSLAVDADGRVWGWGNYLDDESRISTVPVQVEGLPAAKAIRARNWVRLVLAEDGTVWSWGPNYDGEVGDGTTDRRRTPVRVLGLDHVVAISAGDFHAVALKDDGTVWAWGDNQDGGLGDGTSENRSSPVRVCDVAGIVRVGAGAWFTLAEDGNGHLWGWGSVPDASDTLQPHIVLRRVDDRQYGVPRPMPVLRLRRGPERPR